jgi:two-component system LytT family response regulator
MTAILVDDEPPARAHLRRMLESQQVQVLGEGATGLDALSLCEAMKPDLVFLDIQMPDLTGLEAAAALVHMDSPPLLVFVTGFAEHAPKAFEYAAFDYLLKPVEPERLAVTIARASKSLVTPAHVVPPEVKTEELAAVKRLPVRTDYAIKLIRVEDIDIAVAKDKKVYVRAKGVDQKTYYTLVQLERLLPAEEFARVHASTIVRLDRIEELNFLGNHMYSVTLTDGTVIPIGRTYYQDLQRRLGLD